MAKSGSERSADYKMRHPERVRARSTARRVLDKDAVINMYTAGEGTCRMCGQGDIDVLCIDHIHDDGNVERCHTRGGGRFGWKLYRWLMESNYPTGYQVLCANCNLKKEIVRRRGTIEPISTFAARAI